MTDDSGADETTEKTDAAPQLQGTMMQRNNKYRLISGESVLENGEASPSMLAFMGMYILGGLVFGVHLLFHNGLNPADDALFLLKLTATLIDFTNSETVPVGFVLVMGFLAWANACSTCPHRDGGSPSPPCHHATPRHHYGGQFDQHGRRLVYFRFQCVRFYSL